MKPAPQDSPIAAAGIARLALLLLLPWSMFGLLIAAPWLGSAKLAMVSWFTAAALLHWQIAIWGSLRAAPSRGRRGLMLHAMARSVVWVGAGYSTAVEPGVIKLWDTLPLGWCVVVLDLLGSLLLPTAELPKPWVDRLMQLALVAAGLQQSLHGEVAGQGIWAIKAALLVGCLRGLWRLPLLWRAASGGAA